MSLRGWKTLLAGLCLATVLAGCTVPPIPAGVRRDDLRDSGEDGWLLDSLMGRDRTPKPKKTSVVISDAENPDAVTPPPNRPLTPPPLDEQMWDEDDGPQPEDDGFTLEDLDPANVYQDIKAALGYGPNKQVALASFQEGEALYRRGQYADAAVHFERAADRWPSSSLEEKSLFFLGESQFFADDYPGANDAFAKLLAKHQGSRYLDIVAARQFEIGRYWEQSYEEASDVLGLLNISDSTRPTLDTYNNAIKAYESVHEADPTGPLADDALMAAATAHFRQHNFFPAAQYFDMVRKEYPQSDHQLKSHLLGIQSRLGMYQGPLYDGTPLEEADQIAEQTLTQFSDRLGAERDLVVDARNRVTDEKARRDWEMARYFERRGHYRSARFYYQSVERLYPHTELAAQARQRLAEIRDKPDQPPNRFEWLTNIFP